MPTNKKKSKKLEITSNLKLLIIRAKQLDIILSPPSQILLDSIFLFKLVKCLKHLFCSPDHTLPSPSHVQKFVFPHPAVKTLLSTPFPLGSFEKTLPKSINNFITDNMSLSRGGTKVFEKTLKHFCRNKILKYLTF